MEIVFVRHGETYWNVEKRLQGQTNKSKLTENGINQAKEISKRLIEYDYDVIFASPLDRTIKTAEIINENHHKEIITDTNLLERSYGDFEGEYAHNGNYDIEQMWNYDENYNEHHVESVQSFFKRVYEFLDELISKKEYEKVLIVSHNGVSIAMRTYFEGLPKDKDLRLLGIKNCETIEYKI